VDTEQQPAQPGELCTCGRQAVTVYSTEQYGDVGHCGIDGAASRPVLPCPWCGTSEPHKQPWGDPTKCPDYRLRVDRSEEDSPVPQPMVVTRNADGSHSPAYDEAWPEGTQLEWHAGIVALQTGLRIEVTRSSGIQTGVPTVPGVVAKESYHLSLRGPKTLTGTGPISFDDAWCFLDGVAAGVRAMQT
jgi:hypothetical protein